MPPFSPSVMASNVADVQPQLLKFRALGDNSTGTAINLKNEERVILQYIALTFSAVSVASSILAFFWFVRMRRSFRHDLIMLLIQSDMFKALWFMMYPIVVFAQGPIASEHTFCQVNGFFVSIGIEASDFAVLQIALHTALYIWKPRVTRGEGGLYPYRYYAYCAWIILPLLMAALAFINNHNSYMVEGTFCYLPVRPFWYRLALGWIPRYVIFIIILVIYVSIYFYVRYKFDGFTRKGGNPPVPNTDSMDSAEAEAMQRTPRPHNPPPTPTLACHGLIPEPEQDSKSEKDLHKQPSHPSLRSQRHEGIHIATHRFMWASFVAKNSPLHAPTTPPLAFVSDRDSIDAPEPLPAPQYPIMHDSSRNGISKDLSPPMTKLPSTTSWRDHFVRHFSPPISSRPSIIDMNTALRHGPEGRSRCPTPVHRLELVNSHGSNLADVEMRRTREKIRRQLRFLFIYPLVYMGMWIVPFVAHVIQYNDKFAIDPPFALTCVSTIFISSQAAVDSWLFSTREKPWKHIPGTDGTFWGSFKFWTACDPVGGIRANRGPGRTRAEMYQDSRVAYQRRDEEMAERLAGGDSAHLTKPATCHRRSGHWWDVPDFDGPVDGGGMRPVAEELKAHPMDGDEEENPFVEKERSENQLGVQRSSLAPNVVREGAPRKNVSFQDLPVLGKG
ncbi:hypothetical protein HYFRA_00006215 [Hymenoscyphus fraxineus]|uniref:G protein-coupled receptor n=1 Tax=Hymenoscyphus fraxineus TaxID=746836 RepID=A0A9N9LDW7_9HELO|nr:hypothetical protein HYFRA_00006215 [Hymenoscyphus fraxineus]